MVETKERAKNKWVFHGTLNENADVNLICLPHAGGSAMSFATWKSIIPSNFNLCPIQYPMRENRIHDLMPDTIQKMAHNFVVNSEDLFQKPFVLLGHCGGSLIAYEVAKCVKNTYGKLPECLMLSGSISPALAFQRNLPSNASDEEFIQIFIDNGYIDSSLLERKEYLNYFLPIFRKDIKMQADYVFEGHTIFSCPVVTINGNRDKLVNKEGVEDWRNFSSGIFQSHFFDGEHFYINNYKNRIINMIQELLVRSN